MLVHGFPLALSSGTDLVYTNLARDTRQGRGETAESATYTIVPAANSEVICLTGER